MQAEVEQGQQERKCLAEYVHHAARGHYSYALRLHRYDLTSTLAVVFGGVIVLPLSVASETYLGGAAPFRAEMIFASALISVLFGVLQAIYKPGLRLEQHKEIGSEFGTLGKQLRSLKYKGTDIREDLDEIRAYIQYLDEKSPLVPEGVWRKAATRHLSRPVGFGAWLHQRFSRSSAPLDL